MTKEDQDLKALAEHYVRMSGRRDGAFIDTEVLAQGVLRLLAQEEALTAERDEALSLVVARDFLITELQESINGCAKKVVTVVAERDALRADLADRAEWHAAWVDAARSIQMLEAERDALKAQLEQRSSNFFAMAARVHEGKP